MQTHFFHLCYLNNLKKTTDNLPNNNSDTHIFEINSNNTSIFNLDFNSKYNFDSILPLDKYYECNKHLITNQSANYNFIVYGGNCSGKSTLLRGYRDAIENNTNNKGMMLKMVNDTYNKMFDLFENKDDIVVLKFGAFGIDLKMFFEGDEEDSINCLIEKKNGNLLGPNYFDQIVIGSNDKSFTSSYSNVNMNNKCYIIKHIKSFAHLNDELEKVIANKEEQKYYHKSHSILYHFSVEIKNKTLETKLIINLNFFEINCIQPDLLQQFLLRINTKSSNENDILHKLCKNNSHTLYYYYNILCLSNLNIYDKESITCLKILRFLELTFERNDLYENSSELCEHCCMLNDKLMASYKQQEKLLNEIKEMTNEANNIYSIVRGIKNYQKNTINSKKSK